MTDINDWVSRIKNDIADRSSAVTDRTGATPFNLLTDEIRNVGNGRGNRTKILGAIEVCLKDGGETTTREWLRLLRCIEVLEPLEAKETKGIIALVFQDEHLDIRRRAYLLRALCAAGLEVDWSTFSREGYLHAFEKAEPLIFTDCLIITHRPELATPILLQRVRESESIITPPAIISALNRWQVYVGLSEITRLTKSLYESLPQKFASAIENWALAQGVEVELNKKIQIMDPAVMRVAKIAYQRTDDQTLLEA